MTGAQHYCEAEALLARAARGDRIAADSDLSQVTRNREAGEAARARQDAAVHAALAQAAATIEAAMSRGPGDVSHDWREAVGNPPLERP